ncbi:hypothetical protein CN527_04540 [Bacillus cereus]|nr:hypothetical protein CN527_04540 [Bacillus cereus]PGN92701.1 hypothetical protein CN976_23245 [Bacillus cereus]
MTSTHFKAIRFENLIDRADAALEQDFCIEASTIYYAIIEERFHSIFDKINVQVNKNACKMYHSIKRILNIIDNGHFCENETNNSLDNKLDEELRNLIIQEYDRALLLRLDSWRYKRNDIIHDFAKVDMNYDEVRQWASEGKVLLRALLSSTQRLKRKLAVEYFE